MRPRGATRDAMLAVLPHMSAKRGRTFKELRLLMQQQGITNIDSSLRAAIVSEVVVRRQDELTKEWGYFKVTR